MNINWYPGHMKKHLDITKKHINNYDIVLIVLDARLPIVSQNPQFNNVIKGKIVVYVINKIDLVDDKSLSLWRNHFFNNYPMGNYVFITTNTPNLWKIIYEKIQKIESKMQSKLLKKRIMILGIPNVGKSRLINNLANRSSLDVGNKAGLTQSFKYIKLPDGFEITDTPGILWPKFETNEDGYKLAIIHAIKKEVLPMFDILHFIVNFLFQNYFEDMSSVFKFHAFDHELNVEEFTSFLEFIAKEKGFIMKGNNIDYDRTYNFLFKNLNSGKWFKCCFELPFRKEI